MDSPGNMPVSLGEVWVGTTACAPNVTGTIAPFQLAGAAPCAPMNCIIDWPQSPTFVPAAPAPYFAPVPNTHYHFAAPLRLSDEDVERIVKRVAELLKGVP